jgi:RNA polymerase sigma factor for flagellar operon FliA
MDRDTRDALISRHLGLVHHVARQVGASGNGILETDDLIGYGTIGLIQAIDRYDPEQGPSFVSFALHRIRGAMLDATRTLDPLPRSVRRKVKQIDRVKEDLSRSLEREPRANEICGAAGLTEREYREAQTVLSRLAVPLGSLVRQDDGPESDFGPVLISDPSDDDFTERIEKRELLAALIESIERLPEREKLILALHYKEGLSLAEVAKVMDVSQSRISQLKYRALARLRAALQLEEAA